MGNLNSNKNDLPKESQPVQASQGIFILKSMQISIPNTHLIIEALQKGDVTNLDIQLHLLLDMTLYWLRIALDHFYIAESNHINLLEAVENRIDDLISDALEIEFIHCLQVCTSIGFALDAFQSLIRQKIDIPSDKIESWMKNGTSWQTQTNEVFNYAFSIEKQHKAEIKTFLSEMANFRNDAVHTKAKAIPPYFHPDLNRHTDWRLVKYSYKNAQVGLSTTLAILAYVAKKPKAKYEQLREYCDGFLKVLQPMIDDWKIKHPAKE